jgi:hypothetical protein
MSAKRDMKGALAASLKQEEKAVAARVPSFDERLARADKALGVVPAASTAAEPATPKAAPAAKKGEGRAVRDTFSMAREEFEMINDFRKRCAKLGHFANRSVVVRAGILALSRMNDADLLNAVTAVPAMTPGVGKKQP